MQDRVTRDFDWLSACLLFLLVQVTAARLVTTDWTPLLYFAESMGALGTTIGLALGASRFGRAGVFRLAVGYTLTLVPWQISAAMDGRLALDRLDHAGAVLSVSLSHFMRNQPVQGPFLFLVFVCLAFWLMSLSAGYWLARHGSIVGSALVPGVIMVLIQVYADYQPHSSWWLAVYLFLALMLAGRLHYVQSGKRWAERRVFVSEEAWANVLGSLAATVGVVILVAWLVPASPAGLHAAANTWDAISRPILDRLSNAVTSLHAPNDQDRGNFYGSTLTLGEDAAAGDSGVFAVEILSGSGVTPRYYWRGRVYDTYANGRWSTATATNLSFQPGTGSLRIPDADNRSETTLRITMQAPGQSLLYSPSQGVWVDRSAIISAIVPSPGSYDILSWESRTALLAGDRYEATAEVTDPSDEQLRGAPSVYPEWVAAHYLEVPAGLRADMRALAQRLTAGQSSDYDRAQQITEYLRANLQYATSVPAPPEGADPIAWVLFNYKKAFCNYYASAEVLLLRSVGIPARLAVGFAQGEQVGNAYIVRRRDAHAWPEAYFSGIGWVEFEPTASQAALVRSSQVAQSNQGAFASRPARPLEGGDRNRAEDAANPARAKPMPFEETLWGRGLIVAGFMTMGLLFYYVARRHGGVRRLPGYLAQVLTASGAITPSWLVGWLLWTQLPAVEQSFTSINFSLRWLGKPQPMDATPAERARALAGLMPSAAQHISALSAEFESGFFTRRRANLVRARRASFFILMHALRARLQQFLGTLNGRDVYSG